ncbi:hypothetical protein Tco_0810448 [Tanacetum coccineum]
MFETDPRTKMEKNNDAKRFQYVLWKDGREQELLASATSTSAPMVSIKQRPKAPSFQAAWLLFFWAGFGDDDNDLFSMRSLPRPVTWQGSHTECVIAAMLVFGTATVSVIYLLLGYSDVCYHRNGHVFKHKDLRMQKEYGALIPLMALIDWIDLLIQRRPISFVFTVQLQEIINGCSGRCNRCEDIAQTASCTQAESGQKTVDGKLNLFHWLLTSKIASCEGASQGHKRIDKEGFLVTLYMAGSNLANNEDSAVVELKKLKKEMKRMEVALLGVARS